MAKGDPGLFVEYCAKDFLDGTNMLSPWEELAYRRICDMIYDTFDRVPDDDRMLAWATKTGKRWPAIKKVLLSGAKPKLIIDQGFITNERCRLALGTAARKMEQKAIAGRASAATGKSLKNLNRRRTIVPSVVPYAVANGASNELSNEPLNHEGKEEKESPKGDSKKKKVLRPAWLSPSFELPDEWVEAAVRARERHPELGSVNIDLEREKFLNHDWAKPKRDWRRTWINWILNAKGQSNGHKPPPPPKSAPSAAVTEMLWTSRVERWRSDPSTWMAEIYHSPPPDDPRTLVPVEILLANGLTIG
jgi:uncharacterized protein YdaU (DUF1376 family)